MNFVIYLLIEALNIYLYLILASVIVSWLIAFDVLNMRNKLVYKCCYWLNRAVNPPMLYLRRYIPPMGNMDFTPMIVIFLIWLIQSLLVRLL